jgi:hypothetical protein
MCAGMRNGIDFDVLFALSVQEEARASPEQSPR